MTASSPVIEQAAAYAEIAVRLSVSEANARKICSRAVEKLRKWMA